MAGSCEVGGSVDAECPEPAHELGEFGALFDGFVDGGTDIGLGRLDGVGGGEALLGFEESGEISGGVVVDAESEVESRPGEVFAEVGSSHGAAVVEPVGDSGEESLAGKSRIELDVLVLESTQKLVE